MAGTDLLPVVSEAKTTRSRWLRFRLRTLLIVCTLIAITLGWYRHHTASRNEAIQAIMASGGSVGYEYERFREREPNQSWPLKRLNYSLGIAGPTSATLKAESLDEEFIKAHILPLRELKRVRIVGAPATNEALAQLALLKSLEYLFWRSELNSAPFDEIDVPTLLVDCVDAPLYEVLAYLSDLHTLPFAIDEPDLGPTNRKLDMPVTLRLENVPLGVVLDQLLTPNSLGWTVGNGGIVVMSEETATSRKRQATAEKLRAALPNLKVIQIDCDVPGAVPVK